MTEAVSGAEHHVEVRSTVGPGEKAFSVIAALVGAVVGIAILYDAYSLTLAMIPMVLLGIAVAVTAAAE